MEQKITSEGKCIYCQKTFAQKDITKHLTVHLAQMEKDKKIPNPLTYCHIEVEAGEMFLHLLVKGSAKMKEIDDFLREIWLECCGHMSAFRHKPTEIPMNQIVKEVFLPKTKIQHEYDFGSTTTVFLKAHKQYQLSFKNTILLLSRNEPLKLLCATCKKNAATSLCTVCQCNEYSFFCNSCAKKHTNTCDDFSDYSQMQVVNSPRMGECGYTGGSIDVERDGVYKKN